ncbi:hypothetical protein [Nocardia jejuensis]|uniref:hypothetical protein n=1 Tax=Nocardia jejuensis TaxID=328049 RepID=UPI00082DF23B|nr:hypothetical protein [Nocardia jejuensis]
MQSIRRTARIAVAGALVLIPLGAVTIPATADITLEPGVSEVARPHHNDRDPWNDNNSRDPWNNNRHDRRDDDCDRNDRNRSHDPNRSWYQQALPRGAFGSS